MSFLVIKTKMSFYTYFEHPQGNGSMHHSSFYYLTCNDYHIIYQIHIIVRLKNIHQFLNALKQF